MRSVFEKYDGKSPESTVVDYLQEQVRKHLNCPEKYLESKNWVLIKEFGLGRTEGQYGRILELNSAALFSV